MSVTPACLFALVVQLTRPHLKMNNPQKNKKVRSFRQNPDSTQFSESANKINTS